LPPPPEAEHRAVVDDADSARHYGKTREEIEMTTGRTKADDEAQIRARIDEWAKAARAKDIDGVMSHYAPDIVAFDAIAALQFRGAAAYRKHWESCFTLCSGPTTFEIHDLDITARNDVAFCHYLFRCGGTGPDGEEHVGWMRVTVCFRKANGTWVIVHEHFSAPFDPQSGKALLDLEPEDAERTRAA
jgi:ketosteroid isomerase-like protein